MNGDRIQKSKKLFIDKDYRFRFLEKRGFVNILDDVAYIKRMYHARIGTYPNLDSPETFCEKLQWLKLHDRNPIYTQLADKYSVRDYISQTLGNDYLIPLIDVWNSPEDIDFDSLPDEFVLKCTHNSGLGMCVCDNKANLDIEMVRSKLKEGLKQKYYYYGREWPYKNIVPRIIAEQFMTDDYLRTKTNGLLDGLIDYKFYCFNGEPKFLYVGCANIVNGSKHDLLSFYGLDWEPTEFQRDDHEPIPVYIDKPSNFDEMVDIARRLSTGIPFVRIDLYNINGKIYFSEFTFYPGAGFAPFSPERWEKELGNWICID